MVAWLFFVIFVMTVGSLSDALTGLTAAPWIVVVALAIAAAWALFGHYAAGLLAAPFFKSLAIANRQLTLSFGSAGIEGGTPDLQSRVRWEAIEKIIETPTHLFLAISRREALTIPRRAFASDADYEALRSFIVQHAGQHVPVVARR